ncbi:hypothetical protein ABPG74_001103 [Tetrahymena malaccensis]
MSQSQLNKKQGGGPPTKEVQKLSPNMIVQVVSAQIHKRNQSQGKKDAYILLRLGNQAQQTSVGNDQVQFVSWDQDQTFLFYHTKEDKLICELREDDHKSADNFIGSVEIQIQDLINNKGFQGEKKYVAYDKSQQTVADITLNIKYDASIQIDSQKNQQQLQDAFQQQKQASEQNYQIRKQYQTEHSQSQEQISQSQFVNNSQVRKQTPNIVVQILSAQIAQNFEEEKGKMDPYFIMKMGEQQFRTITAKDQGQNPKWNEGAKHGFNRTNENQIILELWEEDEKSSDDYLGSAQVDIKELISEQPPQNEYIIYDDNKKQIGVVQLLIQIDMASIKKNNDQNKSKVNVNQSKQFNVQSLSGLGLQKLDASRTITKEELNQKTKEIQDRLNNIQVKLRPQPLVTYIEDNVHKALLEGMKKLAKERPTNPIRELGMFLINYNEASQDQKSHQN